MNPNVEVTIIYSPKEVRKAISFFILRIDRMLNFMLIVYAILLVAFVLTAVFDRYPWISLLFLLIGLVLHYFLYIRLMSQYKHIYRKGRDAVYQFNEENITITGENIQSIVLWQMYKKAYEIPSAFLLVDQNKLITIIPKNSFADSREAGKLCELLTKKITVFETWK